MTGNANHTTYQNGDDCGMVYEIVLPYVWPTWDTSPASCKTGPESAAHAAPRLTNAGAGDIPWPSCAPWKLGVKWRVTRNGLGITPEMHGKSQVDWGFYMVKQVIYICWDCPPWVQPSQIPSPGWCFDSPKNQGLGIPFASPRDSPWAQLVCKTYNLGYVCFLPANKHGNGRFTYLFDGRGKKWLSCKCSLKPIHWWRWHWWGTFMQQNRMCASASFVFSLNGIGSQQNATNSQICSLIILPSPLYVGWKHCSLSVTTIVSLFYPHECS